MIDETTTAVAEESGSGLNISVDSVFEGILTVFGFFRQIIDFFKSIFTPIFEGLFDSAGDKIDELTAG
ncbi:MAG: hypothetical protein IJK89_00925 [Clostridia bacterium]|nr:hypothetical protein [Clostridia bacterium]